MDQLENAGNELALLQHRQDGSGCVPHFLLHDQLAPFLKTHWHDQGTEPELATLFILLQHQVVSAEKAQPPLSGRKNLVAHNAVQHPPARAHALADAGEHHAGLHKRVDEELVRIRLDVLIHICLRAKNFPPPNLAPLLGEYDRLLFDFVALPVIPPDKPGRNKHDHCAEQRQGQLDLRAHALRRLFAFGRRRGFPVYLNFGNLLPSQLRVTGFGVYHEKTVEHEKEEGECRQHENDDRNGAFQIDSLPFGRRPKKMMRSSLRSRACKNTADRFDTLPHNRPVRVAHAVFLTTSRPTLAGTVRPKRVTSR